MTLQRRAPVDFRLIAMNLDQKLPGFPADLLPAHFERLGVEYRIVEQDTRAIVLEKTAAGKTPCSLCSRLRRGVIYRTAKGWGRTRSPWAIIATTSSTLLLNMLFGGKLKGMPPKL